MTDQAIPDIGGRAASCCGSKPAAGACESSCGPAKGRVDWLLWGSAVGVTAGVLWHFAAGGHDMGAGHDPIGHFAAGTWELLSIMWWGLVLGVVFVGLLDRIPREVVIAALAGERRVTGILRATAAGVAFDLCSHGILMVGMKLYERGATAGQVVAFLLASPWNSLSLTVILIALIGWELTLAFILLSAVIGIITGLIFDGLVARGRLPENPARAGMTEGPGFRVAFREWRRGVDLSPRHLPDVLKEGLKGSRMVLRWLLFGIVLASAIRAFVPVEVFQDWFGPTLLGLALTVVVATIVEVCSEGSAPIAADLVNRGMAPGNGFSFLMAGVATDYTEVMSLKDTTGSWRIALALPLVALPQTIIIGLMLNYL
ncbi:MAG: permease [Pseudomonadota bacterium]